MWKRKRKELPWYRAGDPRGHIKIDKIPEAVKRELDAFRMQEKHPAADPDDLPQEVQDYIGQIEMDLYDKKQEGAAGTAFAFTAFGAALLYFNYRACFFTPPTTLSYVGPVLLIVGSWIWYWREWNKNAEAFTPSEGPWPTDEAIRREWEIKYIMGESKKT